MIAITRSTGQANPPAVPYSAQPLRDQKGVADRPVAAASSPDFVRALGSASQNSRTAGSPGTGATWGIKWQAPLEDPASAVLTASERVLVQRSNGWTLLSADSKKVASGPPPRNLISLDPSVNLFYSLGSGNALHAIAMATGEVRFILPLGQNESFIWPLVHRSGKNIVIVGVEQPMMSPRPRRPNRSLFQVVRVGSPLQLSPYKLLLSLDLQQDLMFSTAEMISAASGDMLWAAMPDLLVRTSPDQTIDGAWTDSFTPVAASCDESGWLYLVAAVSGGDERELWVITPEGARVSRIAIPPLYRESKVPPAVGYDHRIYLRTSQDLIAFSPRGEKLWEAQISGGIAGMTVTPDGRLIVAAGRAIYQVDAGGKVTPLFTALPANATAAPVVTVPGEIFVGTETSVLCLTAR